MRIFRRIESGIEIKSKISFWRHPLKWWKERRCRKVMKVLINQAWNNGMKEDVEEYARDMMIKGHTIIKNKNYFNL